jgi:hypothetical protein
MDKMKRLFGSAGHDGEVPPLELLLEGRRLMFRTPDELGVGLKPRTEVTASFARSCRRLGREVLTIERDQTRRLIDRLQEVMTWCFESGEPVGVAWSEAEGASFVDEHGWRPILRALAAPEVDDRYRRVALVRFLRYLGSRAEALEEALGRAPQRAQQAGVVGAQEARSDRAVAGANEDLSFTSVKRSPLYRRLPAHRAVELSLAAGEAVPIYLAHQRLRIVARADGWILVDDGGLEVGLREGRVIVGRARDCDVALLDAAHDVSRYHLAIERRDDELRLIDLSSQGTYLPRRALLVTPAPR